MCVCVFGLPFLLLLLLLQTTSLFNICNIPLFFFFIRLYIFPPTPADINDGTITFVTDGWVTSAVPCTIRGIKEKRERERDGWILR